jgi:NAD(P)-dependent dehydrogenase (short-subunit alcohol dehydrogenase family)
MPNRPVALVTGANQGIGLQNRERPCAARFHGSGWIAQFWDEPRWLLVGKIDQKHGSAVVTRRGENVRLISVRRSRDEEVTIYESQDI